MSRSYKKTPRSGEQKNKFYKTYANRKLRRNKYHNLQHKSYKKNFCYYDICDYESIGWTFEEWYKRAIRRWYQCGIHYGDSYPAREEEYRQWFKYFKAK